MVPFAVGDGQNALRHSPDQAIFESQSGLGTAIPGSRCRATSAGIWRAYVALKEGVKHAPR